MRSSSYFKTISQILILAVLHLCWLTSYGYAEMIPTESAIEQLSTYNTDRQRILDLLDRQEVIEELDKYGISKVEATARINSLMDEEVTLIEGKLDELPIGQYGDGGFSAALYILYFLPVILAGAIYVACTPIAAGVCIFVDDTWSDCMRNYWGHFIMIYEIIYKGKVSKECYSRCNSILDGKNKTVCFLRCEKEMESRDTKTLETDPDCDPGMESCI